jgi:CRISPR-associated endonuclease/helicase Cas3
MSYYQYWGKAQGDNIHLLPYHCLDVSAFSRAILDNNHGLCETLSKLLCCNLNETKNVVSFLSCIHDIGKFYYGFQKNNKYAADKLGLIRPNGRVFDWIHTHVSYGNGYISKIKTEIPDVLYMYLNASIYHHGKPSKSEGTITPHDDCVKFVQYAVEKFCLPNNVEESPHASWIISGIIVLADWTASGNTNFCSNEINLDKYYNDTLKRAKEKICDLLPELKFISPLTPKKFGFLKLNNLQENVLNIKNDRIVVIESNTGSGKTEAALLVAQNLIRDNKSCKIIYALPSMATTNAMYERMLLFKDVFGTEPVLAHSKSRFLYNSTNNEHTFFTNNRKKSLLANICVSTVDQILLSLLPAKHNSLRLLGLVNSVIIIDEIHCYDHYVIRLIKTLFSVLEDFNIHLILLSATLSKTIKENLEIRNDEEKYPLITSGTDFIYPEDIGGRKVNFKFIYTEESVLNIINFNYNKNFAWIRNTVADAKKAYKIVKIKFPNREIILLHSRFALKHRLEKESRIINLLGKNSKKDSNVVVIATQVIEQSLDISFDEMVTDICPADVIMQRLGRLQRHEGKDTCTLYICVPLYDNNIEKWGKSEDWKKTFFIYNKLLLYRTFGFMRENETIHTANDIRQFIDFCYTSDVVAEQEKLLNDMIEKNMEKTFMAGRRALDLDEPYGLSASCIGWGSDDMFPTRDSEIITQDVVMVDKNRKPLFENKLLSTVRIPENSFSNNLKSKFKDDGDIELKFEKDGNNFACLDDKKIFYNEEEGLSKK